MAKTTKMMTSRGKIIGYAVKDIRGRYWCEDIGASLHPQIVYSLPTARALRDLIKEKYQRQTEIVELIIQELETNADQ